MRAFLACTLIPFGSLVLALLFIPAHVWFPVPIECEDTTP